MRALGLAAAILLSVPAWAGVYLEPYAGYVEATDKATTTPVSSSPTTSQNNEHGVAYGGKLGLSFMKTAIGADFLGGTLTSAGTNYQSQNIGAFLQFGLLPILKFHGTYYFSAQNTANLDSVSIKENGNGFKVGFAFMLAPYIALNFDYLSLHYTKIGPASVFSSIDDKLSGGFVSLSIPIDL